MSTLIIMRMGKVCMLSLLSLLVLPPLPVKFFPTIMRLILTYLLRLSSGIVFVGRLPIGPLSLSRSGVPQGPTTFLHSSSPLSALSTLHCYGWNLAILNMFSPLDGEP